MRRKKISPPAYNHDISALFFLLTVILFATLGLAILFYGETFLFWEHAFSDLGNILTKQGHPNPTSRTIFTTGMLIESYIMLRISLHYAEDQHLRNHAVKRWLALLGMVGFLVSIVPNDINHPLHSTGVGIVIGALYFFTMFFHFELKGSLSKRDLTVDMLVLQTTVFAYAIAFFTDSAAKQFFQKLCVVGIFLSLLRSATITEEGFKPAEIFEFYKKAH